jgi:DNA anti-recombination protein RmuC
MNSGGQQKYKGSWGGDGRRDGRDRDRDREREREERARQMDHRIDVKINQMAEQLYDALDANLESKLNDGIMEEIINTLVSSLASKEKQIMYAVDDRITKSSTQLKEIMQVMKDALIEYINALQDEMREQQKKIIMDTIKVIGQQIEDIYRQQAKDTKTIVTAIETMNNKIKHIETRLNKH